ncbi:MAG: acyl-CoA thioesterase [Alphaproteobacteria bacterium]|nr:MAG: acyl-CoA thioesterase [Alphaproteobacteria bacterium]
MKQFSYQRKVMFGHTDPAGIVFYPRYFEMINETIEEWFAKIGEPFTKIHLEDRKGVPMVHIETDFFKVGRLGDILDFSLRLIKVGRSSFELEITASTDGELRFTTKCVLAFVDMDTSKATSIPDDLKTKFQEWLV